MLKVIQHFGKHCSYHPQDKYVLAGQFWKPYTQQAVGREWDVMNLIGRVEERAAIQLVMSMLCFILKMATAMFAKMLDNF
jgi:hypothetical protein